MIRQGDTIILEDQDLVWAKVKPNAIIPTKDEENMGRDIYACFEEDYILIPPHTTKSIPTGLACAVTPDYGIRLRDRGSNGSKGIHVNAGSVDSSYRGEIFVAWDNTNGREVLLSKLSFDEILEKYGSTDKYGELEIPVNPNEPLGEKYWIMTAEDDFDLSPIVYPYNKAIAQAEVVYVPKKTDIEISYEDLLKIPSKRGTGCLGSSGK